MNYIIDSYIKRLNINDINKFALNNDIVLNRYELDFIYNEIHTNYYKLIHDESYLYKICKDNFNEEVSNKIISLYYVYKKRYKDYL